MPPFTPVRPELSLFAILGYAFFAFSIGLLLTPWFIAFLRKNKLGKQLRVETVDGKEPSIFRKFHEKKFGTPTMGGVLIWLSIVITVVASRLLSLFGLVENSLLQRGQVYIPLLAMVSLGILGAFDDYINIVGANEQHIKRLLKKVRLFLLISVPIGFAFLWLYRDNILALPYGILLWFGIFGFPILLLLFLIFLSFITGTSVLIGDFVTRVLLGQGRKKGLGVLPKLFTLVLVSFFGALWFHYQLGYDSVKIPFAGELSLGIWYIPFFILVIVSMSNAVNVTDGLDGLAGGLLVIAFGAFGVLAYVSGLYILAGFCAVVAAAVSAFLWHNVPPALFYMGDAGSLALGGTLGVIGLMTDHALLLPLIGFVFVLEIGSVVIQLLSKKMRGGKKVFLAAPIHHHFEALEWGESKVTMRLWIIGAFFAFLGIVAGIVG